MLELTLDDIREFRVLHKRETGVDLTDEDARAYAENLMRFVALVTRPDPTDSGKAET